MNLTKRLRNSLQWFLVALTENWIRKVPYVRVGPSSQVVLYSDAESSGHIGVAVLYGDKVWYGHGDIPNSLRRRLHQRKTNIMGYELMAAILLILTLDNLIPQDVYIQALYRQCASEAVCGGRLLQETRF